MRIFHGPALCVLSLCVAAVSAVGQERIITLDVSSVSPEIHGEALTCWKKGGVTTFVSPSPVRVVQGELQVAGSQGVIWFNEDDAAKTGEIVLEVYLEGQIALLQGRDSQRFEQLFIRLPSTRGLVVYGNPEIVDDEVVSPLMRRARKTRAETPHEFASTQKVEEPPPTGAPKPPEAEPLNIIADRFEVMTEDKRTVIVAIGHVLIVRNNMSLSADNVVLWMDEEARKDGKPAEEIFQEFYAEGNVTLQTKNDVIRAERVFEHLGEEKGLFVGARVAAGAAPSEKTEEDKPKREPVYFGGDEIRHVGPDRLETRDGYFTTCGYGHPHWRFQGRRVRLIRTEDAVRGGIKERNVVTSTHNTLRIGDVPVFYWPYLSKDITDRGAYLSSAQAGHSSALGGFVKTQWNLNDLGLFPYGWDKIRLNLDYMSKHGPGVGLETEYVRANSFGLLDTYYVYDWARTDRRNVPVEDENRGRILWRHRQFLDDGWRADVELSYLSDREFLRRFFEQEHWEGKEQETLLYLRKIEDNRAITYLQKHRINDFQTTTEYLPKVGYDIVGEPLWGGRFNYTGHSQVANLQRRVEDDLNVDGSPRTTRFNTNNELSSPFKLWILKFDPYTRLDVLAEENGRSGPLDRGDQTDVIRPRQRDSLAFRRANEQLLRGTGDSGHQTRIYNSYGFRSSTQLARVYNIHNPTFNINRLRHIITPEANFEMVPFMSGDPEDLIQHDEVETVDKVHSALLAARQRFQTKRGKPGQERTVDYITLDMEYHGLYGSSPVQNTDDFLEATFSWQATDRVAFLSQRNRFYIQGGGGTTVNGALSLDLLPRTRAMLGYTHIEGSNSAVTVNLDQVLNEKWILKLYEQYDFNTLQEEGGKNSENLATRVTLTRVLHTWYLDTTVGYEVGENNVTASVNLRQKGARQRALRF